MPQQVFIKVVGFSDAERRALEDALLQPAQRPASYSLWTPGSGAQPQVVVFDGRSEEARLQASAPQDADLRRVWVGENPPQGTSRAFVQGTAWQQVLAAVDEFFAEPAELEFDLDLGGDDDQQDTVPPDEVPQAEEPGNRALIAFPDLGDRLYLRAKLALNHLPFADEAESAAQALEMTRMHRYALVLMDFSLPGGGWDFVRQFKDAAPAIPHVIVAKAKASLPERIRGRLAGLDALLAKPPDPERLQQLLQKVVFPWK